MGEQSKPCELPCEKCGAEGVYRLFRAEGSMWEVPVYGKAGNRYAFAQTHMATASRDHIDHTCQTCRYNWQTLPMRKPRKARVTARGGEG